MLIYLLPTVFIIGLIVAIFSQATTKRDADKVLNLDDNQQLHVKVHGRVINAHVRLSHYEVEPSVTVPNKYFHTVDIRLIAPFESCG